MNNGEHLEEKDQVSQTLLGVKLSISKENNTVRLSDRDQVKRKCSVPIGPYRKATVIAGVPKVKSLSDCTQHGNCTNKNLHQVSSAVMLRKSSMVSNVSNMDFIGSAMHIAYVSNSKKFHLSTHTTFLYFYLVQLLPKKLLHLTLPNEQTWRHFLRLHRFPFIFQINFANGIQ